MVFLRVVSVSEIVPVSSLCVLDLRFIRAVLSVFNLAEKTKMLDVIFSSDKPWKTNASANFHSFCNIHTLPQNCQEDEKCRRRYCCIALELGYCTDGGHRVTSITWCVLYLSVTQCNGCYSIANRSKIYKRKAFTAPHQIPEWRFGILQQVRLSFSMHQVQKIQGKIYLFFCLVFYIVLFIKYQNE